MALPVKPAVSMPLQETPPVGAESFVDVAVSEPSHDLAAEDHQSNGRPQADTVASLLQEHQAHMCRCFRDLLVQHECVVYDATQLLHQNLDKLLGGAATEWQRSRPVPQMNARLPSSLVPIVSQDGHWAPPPETEAGGIRVLSGILEERAEPQPSVEIQPGASQETQSGPSQDIQQTIFQKAQSKLLKPSSGNSQIISMSVTKHKVEKMNLISRCVHSGLFESVVSVSILANTIFLGFQVQTGRDASPVENRVQIMFCAIFSAELCLRMFADPRRFFTHDFIWNLLDTLTVISSVVELVISIVHRGHAQANIVILRVLRLLKILRVALVVRVRAFRELRLMIHSMVHCLKPLIWAVMLLLVVVYVFAILFTQGVQERLISGRHTPNSKELTEYFSSTLRSTRTLLAAVLGGKDWSDYATPLGSLHWGYELAFFAYIIFTNLALLNVVTGIFVDSSLNSALHDKQIAIQNEMLRRGLHKQELSGIFAEAANRKSVVSIRVMEDYLKDERVRTYLRVLDVSYDDPQDLIKCLDADENGMIDADEFVKGCTDLASQHISDMVGALQENKRLCLSITEMLSNLQQKVDVQLSKISLAVHEKAFFNRMTGPCTAFI